MRQVEVGWAHPQNRGPLSDFYSYDPSILQYKRIDSSESKSRWSNIRSKHRENLLRIWHALRLIARRIQRFSGVLYNMLSRWFSLSTTTIKMFNKISPALPGVDFAVQCKAQQHASGGIRHRRRRKRPPGHVVGH